MGIFNKKINPKKMSEEFSKVILKNSVTGSKKVKAFLKIFNNTFELEQYMKVYLEFVFFQIHIIDKLASNHFDPIFRNELINSTLNKLNLEFCSANSFDNVCDDKKTIFLTYFHEAFHSYPPQGSLFEDGETQVTFLFTKRLSEKVIDKEIVASDYLIKHVHDMLEGFLKEILLQKPFNKLMRAKK